MHAAILHAPGDERLALDIAAKLAPAETFTAGLRSDTSVTLGDKLALYAIWSAAAEAAGLGQALSRVVARAAGRCIVVRADGTPLPPLPPGAALLTVTDAAASFQSFLGRALSRITPAPAASTRVAVGDWTPGVSIGLAIYAGMFVAAGAWRSDEVNDAIANGTAVPLASALHSFQVATADAVTGAVQIAQAPSVPTAAFVQPQRVVLTAALDSQTIPIVAADVADSAPLAAVTPVSARTTADDLVAPPVRLHAIEPETIVAASFTPDQPVTLAVGANDTF
jgi:hypothetical protein